MKKLSIVLFLLFSSIFNFAQNVTGDWFGTLGVQGSKLRIVFHITENEGKFNATMDSPDQGAKGIPISDVTFQNPKLTLFAKAIGFEYNGKTNESFTKIEGKFKQAGMEFDLELLREAVKVIVPNRPQEPKEPYPYYTKDVKFFNSEDNVELAGTISLPDTNGKYPAVVLISGSGPQNRNSKVFGHKIFLVLADYLTRNGIAVLRYDDRGVGESKGNIRTATSFNYALDALAGVQYLQSRNEIDKNKIGLIGMSEGGMIAPIATVLSDNIAFNVLLAGPGIPIPDLLQLQTIAISRANEIPEEEIEFNSNLMQGAYKILNESKDNNTIESELRNYFRKQLEDLPKEELEKIGNLNRFIEQQVRPLLSPWFRYFINYNPKENLSKIKCPVLAINGEKDLQVLPKEDLTGIEKALKKGGNKNFTIKELPGLNHILQKCETGSPSEYAKIEETMNPLALKTISEWIQNIVK